MFVLLSGCATLLPEGERIENLDLPIHEIQKAVEINLPTGRRQVSSNGREYLSDFFIVTNGKIQPAGNSSDRFYAHIYILGDRRPYVLQISVIRERKMGGETYNAKYEKYAYDQRIAKVIAKRIQATLSKRRDDRNIIDDFRVF